MWGSQPPFSYDHCAYRLYNCICMRSKTSLRRVLRLNNLFFILILLWYFQNLINYEFERRARTISNNYFYTFVRILINVNTMISFQQGIYLSYCDSPFFWLVIIDERAVAIQFNIKNIEYLYSVIVIMKRTQS